MRFLNWVKKQLLGDEPDNYTFYLIFYAFGTLVFGMIFIFFVSAGIILKSRESLFTVILTFIFSLILFLLVIRLMIGFIQSLNSLYQGENGIERGGDDFSEIEALVAFGEVDEAIERYKVESRERNIDPREPPDFRPDIRIGELLWLNLRDYTSALSQFASIARKADNPNLKLDMYSRMMEIYRIHLPEHPAYERHLRRIRSEFPKSQSAKIADKILKERNK